MHSEDRMVHLQDSSMAAVTPVPAVLLSTHPSPDSPSSIPLRAPTECVLSSVLFPSSLGINATLGIFGCSPDSPHLLQPLRHRQPCG